MLKSCQLTNTTTLPPIGTRVAVIDNGPVGTVTGFATECQADCLPHPESPLVPVVVLRLDHGFYLPGYEGECWISSITVHPDNLLRDDRGNWATENR